MKRRPRNSAWTLVMLAALPAAASEIVYVPVNPNFGGSPLNGPVLLGNAQAQDDHKDPAAAASGWSSKTPLEQFNDALQRSVLSRLSSAVSGTLIGADGGLLPGIVETTDFTIQIMDLGGGMLRFTTTDKNSGSSTSFDVSSTL